MGTSRPTYYRCLWDDNKLSGDQLQRLTYHLCYTQVRCTRSISIPAPAYYAHLVVMRARFHLMEKDSGLDTIQSVGESESGKQGAAFRGRKFRIFLEKAIIDVKYHSRPFLMEDFYIFIFFVIYRQGNISNIFFVIFRREKISFSF